MSEAWITIHDAVSHLTAHGQNVLEKTDGVLDLFATGRITARAFFANAWCETNSDRSDWREFITQDVAATDWSAAGLLADEAEEQKRDDRGPPGWFRMEMSPAWWAMMPGSTPNESGINARLLGSDNEPGNDPAFSRADWYKSVFSIERPWTKFALNRTHLKWDGWRIECYAHAQILETDVDVARRLLVDEQVSHEELKAYLKSLTIRNQNKIFHQHQVDFGPRATTKSHVIATLNELFPERQRGPK